MPLYKNTHGIGALHLGSATVGLEVRSLHRGPGITTHLHCGTGEVKSLISQSYELEEWPALLDRKKTHDIQRYCVIIEYAI